MVLLPPKVVKKFKKIVSEIEATQQGCVFNGSDDKPEGIKRMTI